MASARESLHGEWSSKIAFIMAASGAAIGLGNIWKFPYITGANGGGAFVMIYILCVLLMGIPIMMAEILLGRHGRRNPATTFAILAEEGKHAKHWYWAGFIGILSGFLILSYYSVIAGWGCDYIFHAAMGKFSNATANDIQRIFNTMVSNPWTLLLWHTLVISATTFVVALGLETGLEKSISFMFPTMIVLLLIVVAYAMTTGHFIEGLTFLFKPDFHKLSANGALIALGHSFFTLSLATGTMMVYGAYLPKNISITQAALSIAIADSSVALLAGMGIFPIVFAHHLEPQAGPGLIFKTLPLAFGNMPFGNLIATFFFIMLTFAAFTSAISLLEPSVAFVMEKFHLQRATACMLCGSIIWFLGIGTILSFNILQDFKLFSLTFFELLDYLTANIMLPTGGLLISIFAVWVLRKEISAKELNLDPQNKFFVAWQQTLRFVSPLAILLVTLDFLGVY